MEFDVYETKETVRAVERPIVVITSNNEKELPDAFLRRCFFHYIKFPDRETMQAIVDVHFPGIQKILVSKAMDIFYEVREVPGLKKKPSTSELLDWLKLLLHEDMPLDVLQNRDPTKAIPPLHGALLKNEQDVMLFERLAFMARRQGGQRLIAGSPAEGEGGSDEGLASVRPAGKRDRGGGARGSRRRRGAGDRCGDRRRAPRRVRGAGSPRDRNQRRDRDRRGRDRPGRAGEHSRSPNPAARSPPRLLRGARSAVDAIAARPAGGSREPVVIAAAAISAFPSFWLDALRQAAWTRDAGAGTPQSDRRRPTRARTAARPLRQTIFQCASSRDGSARRRSSRTAAVLNSPDFNLVALGAGLVRSPTLSALSRHDREDDELAFAPIVLRSVARPRPLLGEWRTDRPRCARHGHR